jgi:hypothetical protein
MMATRFRAFRDYTGITEPARANVLSADYLNYPLSQTSGTDLDQTGNYTVDTMTLSGTDGGEWGDGWLTSNGALNSRVNGLTTTNLMSLDTIGDGQIVISCWLAMDNWNTISSDASFISYGVCNASSPGFNAYITSTLNIIINTSGDGVSGTENAVRSLFPLGYAGGYAEVPITFVFSKNHDNQIVLRSFVSGYASVDITNTTGTAWTASSSR